MTTKKSSGRVPAAENLQLLSLWLLKTRPWSMLFKTACKYEDTMQINPNISMKIAAGMWMKRRSAIRRAARGETWAASRSAFLDIPEIRRCVQSCTEWGTTFRKNFRRVVRIVKYLKNERITLAWRLFYFWPIKKIRLQKKVRRFWIQNQWIWWRWERFSIRKSMKHQPWSTITTDVLLKYTDLKSMLFVMCSEISNFF